LFLLLPVCCDCRIKKEKFEERDQQQQYTTNRKRLNNNHHNNDQKKRRRRRTSEKIKRGEEEIQLREFVSITDAGYHSNVQVSHAI
jgi:hypothetical protein